MSLNSQPLKTPQRESVPGFEMRLIFWLFLVTIAAAALIPISVEATSKSIRRRSYDDRELCHNVVLPFGNGVTNRLSNVPKKKKKVFVYGQDKIRGVNLGGWLVLEPWITPSLFDQFLNSSYEAVDEWTFTQYLGQDAAREQLTKHWDTWITEQDIACLSKYGINHVRIPIGYWAFDIKDGEPWVSGAFDYLLNAISWAQKYNIKVLVDLHGAPGSQNGFDNSGKRGDVLWQTGSPDNVPRTIRVLKLMAKKLAPYRDTVTAIELLNEPASWGGNQINITRKFYQDAYQTVREINSGILIVIHDAFLPLTDWNGFMRPPDYQNVSLDTHSYLVFLNDLLKKSQQVKLDKICGMKMSVENSNKNLWTMVGEWSLADTDCARYLNGFKVGARWDGTFDGNPPICKNCTCVGNEDPNTWSDKYKQFLRNFAEAQMDAYEAGAGWIFWTAKTESSPQWSYLFLVKNGYISKDPTQRSYKC